MVPDARMGRVELNQGGDVTESTLCFLRYIEQKNRKFEGHTFAEWRKFWLADLVDDEFYMDWIETKGLSE